MRPDSDAPADRDLRALLSTLDPKARDDLRRALIRDQVDRDAISSQLLRFRDERGDDWADIDILTMYPEARRRASGSSANWRLHEAAGTRTDSRCHS